MWKISFIAAISNLCLNLLFIPYYGVIAAAVTTYISLMYLGYSGYLLKEYKTICKINYYPLIWLLITFSVGVIIFLFKDVSLILKFTLSIGVVISIFALILKFKTILIESKK